MATLGHAYRALKATNMVKTFEFSPRFRSKGLVSCWGGKIWGIWCWVRRKLSGILMLWATCMEEKEMKKMKCMGRERHTGA